MTTPFAHVTLELESWPQSVTLVRGMLAGVGEELSFDAELQDDLKTAVSEACNNVVMHAYVGLQGPLAVAVEIDGEGVHVTVRDQGGGIQQVTPSEDRMGVGLAVISALAQRAEFVTPADGGTEVRMSFAGRWDTDALPDPLDEPEAPGRLPERPDGSIRGTVSPSRLLSPVLGRVMRVLAAGSHFSLDRFSDLYLVVDDLAVHAEQHGQDSRLQFGIEASNRRLQVYVAPFKPGSGQSIGSGQAEPALAALTDELETISASGYETLRILLLDRQRRAAGAE